MKEFWRPIPGFPYYLVSNWGRVCSTARSVTQLSRDGNSYTRNFEGRVLKPCKCAGYPAVGLCRDGVSSNHHIHVLVLEIFCGPRPEGAQACHWDGDKTNNRLENLRWDTRASNSADRLRHGTVPFDERHPGMKLSPSQVLVIREAKGSHASIATEFKVSRRLVGQIKRKERRAHVK